MDMMFLICATLGGTVFIFQFVMTLIGMGAEGADFPDDIPDDLPSDAPDFDAEGGSFQDHGSTMFFSIISFRTVVAALTFFGLAGAASRAGDLGQALSLLIAVAAGGSAMYAVHWLMQLLHRLGHEGNMRISQSVGKTGTVYIPIPPDQTGAGKIQLNLHDRIIEIAAVTNAGEILPTGARVEVIRMVSPRTLEVRPLGETKSTEAAQASTV
jgi:hypothetical protein